MKRVRIKRSVLFSYVVGWTLLVIVGLAIWTGVDPPLPRQTFFLTEHQNEYGETIVSMETHCASDSWYWLLSAMSFHLVLLMWAAVLAFQTRNIPQKVSPR